MAKTRLGSAFGAAFVVSAIIGTVVMFPAWLHHDIKLDSPVYATEAEANAWVRRFEAGAGAACIKWSVSTQIIDEGFNAGWYARYRCNTQHAVVRVGMGYAIPALLVLILAFVLTPRDKHRAPRRK